MTCTARDDHGLRTCLVCEGGLCADCGDCDGCELQLTRCRVCRALAVDPHAVAIELGYALPADEAALALLLADEGFATLEGGHCAECRSSKAVAA